MKILYLTAGAAGMYCGTCFRDNALAAELKARGHDVLLLPLYTPTSTDEPNVSHERVFFGGISVYLEQHLALFRRTPRLLDRLWDSPAVLRAVSGRGVPSNPKLLGELTVSVLQGERGVLRKEVSKLVDWLRGEPRPDVINLQSSLFAGLARPLGQALGRPICCTLQGEDLFMDGLKPPYRDAALELVRAGVADVDVFIAVSRAYADFMARYLAIPPGRIRVVPLGINLEGYPPPAPASDGPSTPPRPAAGPFTVGFFSRVAPEKGLHVLCEAYAQMRRRRPQDPARLEVAGYLSPEHRPYLSSLERQMRSWGLGDEFTYRGVLDRREKIRFLRSLDVLSVPATYDEPKGLPLLEAMACGVPVVQPRRGSFPELVERAGGGLLVDPDGAASLAAGILSLWSDRQLAMRLGQAGARGVREHFTVALMADRVVEVYEAATRPHAAATK